MNEQAARPHRPLQEPQPVEEVGVRADVAVAIGGSAGAIGVLLDLMRDLPPDLPAAILVVIHVPSNSRSVLPRLLAKASGLPCVCMRLAGSSRSRDTSTSRRPTST